MRRVRASTIRLLRLANWWRNSSFSSFISEKTTSFPTRFVALRVGEEGVGRRSDFCSFSLLFGKWNDLESGRAFSLQKEMEIAFVDEKTGAIFFVFLSCRVSFSWFSHLDGDFPDFGETIPNYGVYQLVIENNPLQYSQICQKLGLRAWKRSKWKNLPSFDPKNLAFAFFKVYISIIYDYKQNKCKSVI